MDGGVQALGLTVGTIVSVDDHPGARAPSYRLEVDLGPGGRRAATLPGPRYTKDDLRDRQVVCVTGAEELTILAVHSHARGLVLVTPEGTVENGAAVA